MLSLCGSCLLGSGAKKFCELEFPTSWSLNSLGLFGGFKRFMPRAREPVSSGRVEGNMSKVYQLVVEKTVCPSAVNGRIRFSTLPRPEKRNSSLVSGISGPEVCRCPCPANRGHKLNKGTNASPIRPGIKPKFGEDLQTNCLC